MARENPGYSPKVLVVDDEPRYRRLIVTNLKLAGYQAVEAPDGVAALELLAVHDPDVVLLDLRLPDLDGYEVCRRIRHRSRVPIVMVTAMDTEAATIQGLDFGADDYVVKPFRPEELLARIRAVLRRVKGADLDVPLACGDVTLDPATREVLVDDRRSPLTPTEWRLMETFVQQCGKVLTHEYLLSHVWGPEYHSDSEYLRVYVRRLRKMIERDPRAPLRLTTRAGIGYVLNGQVPADERTLSP